MGESKGRTELGRRWCIFSWGIQVFFSNWVRLQNYVARWPCWETIRERLQNFQVILTAAFINLNKKKFPEIESVKCCCLGKYHTFVDTWTKPTCGCTGTAFIQAAKRNHYCALVHAGSDPEIYRETLLSFGKYYCRDIHQWEGGSCSFRLLLKCICKKSKIDVDGFERSWNVRENLTT